ncbi:MAG: MFS transporter [Synechococcales cyanobacterium K44_A2020_017]|nr:MFS transporter [Synechococcales cyanobacterium K32_A2020_035]MBF2095113.1 MFS transporter [Synechococcales cyanobacterium K44_A2020_017]
MLPSSPSLTLQANKPSVKIALLLVSTLTIMAGATIAPSLPAMRAHFSAVPNADYWVRLALTLPALLIALGAPIVGVAIDRLGRKPLLLAALLLYGIAGSAGFWLESLQAILVSRAFLGLSVASIMTITVTLAADYYKGPALAQFLGLQSGFMSLGGVVFLTFGGFLAELDWRYPFLIYLLALVWLPLAVISLPEPECSLSSDRASPALPQTTGEIPAAKPEKFLLSLVVMTYGMALISQIIFYLIPTQLPFYLQQTANAGVFQSGLAIALMTLFSAVSSLNYRRIKHHLGFITIYGIAFANLALGYALISWSVSYEMVLMGLAIAGMGLGLLMPNMNLCLTTITPNVLRGRVLSGITTFFFIGQFLSPLLSQPLSAAIGLGAIYGLAAALLTGLTICVAVVRWQWRSG